MLHQPLELEHLEAHWPSLRWPQLGLEERQQFEQQRSVRFDPVPQPQLEWEQSVARCPSPRSVPLEREGSAVYQQTLRSVRLEPAAQ
jgi:hypothetical protein